MGWFGLFCLDVDAGRERASVFLFLDARGGGVEGQRRLQKLWAVWKGDADFGRGERAGVGGRGGGRGGVCSRMEVRVEVGGKLSSGLLLLGLVGALDEIEKGRASSEDRTRTQA